MEGGAWTDALEHCPAPGRWICLGCWQWGKKQNKTKKPQQHYFDKTLKAKMILCRRILNRYSLTKWFNVYTTTVDIWSFSVCKLWYTDKWWYWLGCHNHACVILFTSDFYHTIFHLLTINQYLLHFFLPIAPQFGHLPISTHHPALPCATATTRRAWNLTHISSELHEARKPHLAAA